MNSVQLSGKLCRGGELRILESGKQVYNGSIAYWNSYKKDTEFYRFAIFGKQAYYFNEWTRDGVIIGIEGSLSTSKWTDKKTGTERRDISIMVSRFDVFTPREELDKAGDDQRPDNQDFPEDPSVSGDLPF